MRFFSLLFASVVISLPSMAAGQTTGGGTPGPVACTCVVQDGTTSCQVLYGNRVDTPQQTIDDYSNTCVRTRCTGTTCNNPPPGQHPLQVDVSPVNWGTLRVAFRTPVAPETGVAMESNVAYSCQEIHFCNECIYYDRRPGLSAGKYCAKKIYYGKAVPGYAPCPAPVQCPPAPAGE
jgi:hypothetical protein